MNRLINYFHYLTNDNHSVKSLRMAFDFCMGDA